MSLSLPKWLVSYTLAFRNFSGSRDGFQRICSGCLILKKFAVLLMGLETGISTLELGLY